MKQIMKQSMRRLIKAQQGFTLVELMIVVAIIGILAAIAVPQFMAYRVRSYNAGAKAVAHNLKADEANLNSELGVYGHTEAAQQTLVDGSTAIAIADTNFVPAMASAATNAVAGGRMVGNNFTNTRSIAIPIALGATMAAVASDINDAADNSTFHIFTRHIKGDTAYAIDNDLENALLSVTNANWPGSPALGATNIAAALPASPADVNGIAGGGQGGTPNWTRVP